MANLNLLLLGLPGAGKSALLGALNQAVAANPSALRASFQDVSGELAKLEKAATGGPYQPTLNEITAYPVRLEADGAIREVALLDCGGARAKSLLGGLESVTSKEPLPSAVRAADGVLLLVDASIEPKELDRQFRQAIAFLKSWESARSAGTEVGGLPVFLVLTKCDKIARAGESKDQWKQRLKDAERRVAEQFRSGLADFEKLAFGRIDVRVWAAAIREPAEPAKSRGNSSPYQVAELFRESIAAAESFRGRRDRSYQTLHSALVGLAGLAALLALTIGWYVVTEPTLDQAALESQVQTLIVGGDAGPAEQVREPIDERVKELEAVQKNPAFEHLPSRTRNQVRSLLETIESYRRLNQEFQKVKSPRLATREVDLKEIESSLAEFDGPLKSWEKTRLANRHEEWRSELAALRAAIVEEEKWTRDRIEDGKSLHKQGGLVIAGELDKAKTAEWFAQVAGYSDRGRRHKGTDRVLGTSLPYRVVYQIDRVDAVEREWGQVKDNLATLGKQANATAK